MFRNVVSTQFEKGSLHACIGFGKSSFQKSSISKLPNIDRSTCAGIMFENRLIRNVVLTFAEQFMLAHLHQSYNERQVFRECVLTTFEKQVICGWLHESYFEKLVFRHFSQI